jgi:hypothetical protein
VWTSGRWFSLSAPSCKWQVVIWGDRLQQSFQHFKTDARQTHLQYDAHVPLSRHSGKSSDPRKDHEAFRSRSFLPQRVKAHQFGTQMNRTCMKRQNHSNWAELALQPSYLAYRKEKAMVNNTSYDAILRTWHSASIAQRQCHRYCCTGTAGG